MSHRTRYLARMFGLFMVAAALWLLTGGGDMRATVDALVQDRAATLLLSFMCLGAGLATVLAHNVWSKGLAPALVSLLGWLLLIRGTLLLLLPHSLLQTIGAAVLVSPLLYGAGAVALAIGVFLTYAGFRAGPILTGQS